MKKLFIALALLLCIGVFSFGASYNAGLSTTVVTVNATGSFVKGIMITNDTTTYSVITILDDTTTKAKVIGKAQETTAIDFKEIEWIACGTSLKVSGNRNNTDSNWTIFYKKR